jgi:hypothetical protein
MGASLDAGCSSGMLCHGFEAHSNAFGLYMLCMILVSSNLRILCLLWLSCKDAKFNQD